MIFCEGRNPIIFKFSKSAGTFGNGYDGVLIDDIHAIGYDIGFLGGYDENLTAEALSVRTYGQTVMGRYGTFVGTVGYLDSGPNGNTIIDIEKNGTSIFTTKPQFTQTTALTGGTLSSTPTFAPNDRITLKVTQIGSTAQPGTGMRVILKCKV